MKIKFGDRLLIAFSGLLILLAGVGLFVFGTGIFPFRLDVSEVNGPFELWQRAVMVAVSLALTALGIYGVWALFRRDGEKGFIIQHTEFGDMSISMNAMESMVKKCVDSHQELAVNTTRIHRSREGVVVDMKITLAGGVNIPLTVNALQKQIKQYITSCSGVDVREVRVMVETGGESRRARRAQEAPAPEPQPSGEAPGASKPEESFPHRLFSHTGEPECHMPQAHAEGGPELPAQEPEPAPADARPVVPEGETVETEARPEPDGPAEAEPAQTLQKEEETL